MRDHKEAADTDTKDKRKRQKGHRVEAKQSEV